MITLKILSCCEVDSADEDYEVEFPSKMEVCDECGGHGTVLIEGLRGHAFSREEFEDTFDDDEDRAAYFQRGGKYDVSCPSCKGKNVVEVVDEEKLTPELKVQYQVFLDQEEERAAMDRADRRTMRMECGQYD